MAIDIKGTKHDFLCEIGKIAVSGSERASEDAQKKNWASEETCQV